MQNWINANVNHFSFFFIIYNNVVSEKCLRVPTERIFVFSSFEYLDRGRYCTHNLFASQKLTKNLYGSRILMAETCWMTSTDRIRSLPTQRERDAFVKVFRPARRAAGWLGDISRAQRFSKGGSAIMKQ